MGEKSTNWTASAPDQVYRWILTGRWFSALGELGDEGVIELAGKNSVSCRLLESRGRGFWLVFVGKG